MPDSTSLVIGGTTVLGVLLFAMGTFRFWIAPFINHTPADNGAGESP
jgi:hypothetical protein